MKTLGIITGRGGSRRVLGKNIKLLGGVPLIYWTANSSFNSKLDGVVLSTDSEDISKATIQTFDLPIFYRPDWLANDRAPHLPVIIHAVEMAREHFGYDHDAVMILQPTSPFRDERHINKAIDLMKENKCDTVVGVDLNDKRNGAIYLFKTELLFSKEPTFFGKHIVHMPMDLKASINIDTLKDFKLAEDIISNKN